MRAKLFSTFLVVLLAGSLLWGPCAACAAAPVKASGHGCCGQHTGNCKMPAPKQQGAKVCPNLALAPASHHNTSVPVVVAPAAATVEAPPAIAAAQPAHAVKTILDTSPPAVYLLNSVLLV